MIIFVILCYGSLLLTPFCLVGLAICGVGIIAGNWNANGFRDRWENYKKLVIGLASPIIVLALSLFWFQQYRSFPHGYNLVYMNNDACFMVAPDHTVVIDEHILESSIVRDGNIVRGRLANGKMFSLNTFNGNVSFTGLATSRKSNN